MQVCGRERENLRNHCKRLDRTSTQNLNLIRNVHLNLPRSKSGHRESESLDSFISSDSESEVEGGRLDDGEDDVYRARLQALESENGEPSAYGSRSLCVNCVSVFEMLDGRFKVKSEMYEKLFDYQKQGVQWMRELHKQNVGGIIGDEMGLGKTAQVGLTNSLSSQGLSR